MSNTRPACEGCPDPGLPCAGCPAVEPEPCRYTQPDGTRCTRPGGPRHGMCGPHYWARDDEGHAPIVEPEPRCVRGLPAGNCCERYDTCELVDAEACSPDDYETGPERVRDALRANLAGRVVDVDAVLESTTNLDDASVHYQQGWDAGHTAGIDTGQVDERARIVAIIGPCNDEAWCADVDDCGWCRHGEFLIRQINGGPTDA